MDRKWMTARQAAEKWGVSQRYVQRLLAEGRVPEVRKHGRSWMIPSETKKPSDPRNERVPTKSATLSCFSFIWDRPVPGQEIDTILQTIEHNALRAQCLGEIAYLRGEFNQAKSFVAEALDDEAVSIRASLYLMLVAISTNDFPLYSRIEASLKQRTETADESHVAVLAETVLATVAVGMFAPEMAPGWLKQGDFSHLPEEALPFALFLRVKYLQNLADYPQMFAVAQAVHSLCKGKSMVMDIHLLLMCAVACVGLGQKDKARAYLLEAMALGIPHGFITPFVENVATLYGLVEECVKEQYPDILDAMIAQWQETWKNWAVFHNHFARNNVPLILTLRECRIANMAAVRVPYAEIARQESLSVGRVRNIVQDIYGKLFVHSRDELADLILWKSKKS